MFCLSLQPHHRPQCQYRCHRAAPSRQPLTSCAPEAIRSCCPRFRWMLWPDPLLLSMSPGPLRSSPLTLIWASAAGTSLTPVELDFVWVWGGRGGQGSERGKGGCREMWESAEKSGERDVYAVFLIITLLDCEWERGKALFGEKHWSVRLL